MSNPYIGALGERLRLARQIRGWTLRELEKRSKVSNPNISQVENGRHDITATRLASLAQALGVSADWLLGLRTKP